MAALGIDFSDRQPMTVFVGAPGRFNLVGQQVSMMLDTANELEDASFKAACKAQDKYEDGTGSLVDCNLAWAAYDRAVSRLAMERSYERYQCGIDQAKSGLITNQEQLDRWNDYLNAWTRFRSM
jgi:hypothetical protein